jgi:hypothetical protein
VQQLRARVTTCLVATAVVIALVGCGSDSDSDSGSPGATDATPTTRLAGPQQNACPVDGCEIRIDEVVREGDELKVTWTSNFRPDFSRNHVHVYWDTFSPDQVSNDAAARGVEQGSWHPTDAYPSYTTESEASVARRNGSERLCVTAGDRNHDVIDAKIFQCTDVKELL